MSAHEASQVSTPLADQRQSGGEMFVRSSSALPSFTGSGVLRTSFRSFVSVRPSMVERMIDMELESVKGLNWIEASLLVVAEVLGIGILSVPGGFRKLGWVWAVVFIAACYPLNLYTSLLLVRVRRMASESVTLSDLAGATVGKIGGVAVRCMLLGYLQCLLGDFVLVIGRQIFSMLSVFENCTALCIASFISILIALVICLVYMLTNECADVTPDDLGFPWTSLVAVSGFSLACAGQSVYLEMMSEMREPEKFAWSLHMVVPGLVVIYALTGAVTYGKCGDNTPSMMTDVVPDKTAMKGVIAFLVFLHTVVSYTINQQVLGRNLHSLLSPDKARVLVRSDDGFVVATVQWFAITVAQNILGVVFAVLSKDFDRIVTLVSALFVGPLSYLLPIICLLAVPRVSFSSDFRRTRVEEIIAWTLLSLMIVYTVLTIICAIIPFVKA